MSLARSQATQQVDEKSLYPCSDGQPMGEATFHVQAVILLLQALQDFFRDSADVFVAANLLWYWEEGNANARKAPDVLVVRGVGKEERRSFVSWQEINTVPTVVFEVASLSTWREDLYEKPKLYARLGVREYFLFDPEAQYLRPALQGFRRNQQGIYAALEPDAKDRLESEELGLHLRAEGALLRLMDPYSGRPVLTKDERIAQLQTLLEEIMDKQA
jgi:Uma2 family endonuclease